MTSIKGSASLPIIFPIYNPNQRTIQVFNLTLLLVSIPKHPFPQLSANMRFTAALLSALFVATGLAAPILEVRDAAAAELDARYRGCGMAAIFPLDGTLDDSLTHE